MTDELIEKRLTDLEKKIDKVIELSEKTSLQEYRIKKVEDATSMLSGKVAALERRPGDTALKWAAVIIAGFITVLIGFIAVKLGLK